jgi:hypothetical protein
MEDAKLSFQMEVTQDTLLLQKRRQLNIFKIEDNIKFFAVFENISTAKKELSLVSLLVSLV